MESKSVNSTSSGGPSKKKQLSVKDFAAGSSKRTKLECPENSAQSKNVKSKMSFGNKMKTNKSDSRKRKNETTEGAEPFIM